MDFLEGSSHVKDAAVDMFYPRQQRLVIKIKEMDEGELFLRLPYIYAAK